MVVEHGDCLERMAALPDGYATAIVTDPPYGLSFMGKNWDHGAPGVPFWSEALRVVRPGSMLLAFGGTRTYHRLACAIQDAGWEIRDCLSWIYGQGFPKSKNLEDAGAEWHGYGTALKPAWEPIILAMRPTVGTFSRNAVEQGVAGLNVDGCRIGTEGGRTNHTRSAGDHRDRWEGNRSTGEVTEHGGRWPANLALDEEAAGVLDEHVTPLSGRGNKRPSKGGTFKVKCVPDGGSSGPEYNYDAGGGPSRFFYTAKASKADRGTTNSHPTVKPLSLMRWLVRMVTMPSGTLILDPFMGSGTTGVACAEEGVDFHGIEKEAAYFEIANERIRRASAQGRLF